MSRTTPIDIFIPTNSFVQNSNQAIITKMNVEVGKTININLSSSDWSSVFNPYDDLNVFNPSLIPQRLRLFFNIKDNYKQFSNDVLNIISYNYNNVSINSRKLNKLCMGDGSIWNALFMDSTTLQHPDISDRNTYVYEEISYDIKNIVDQSDSGLPENFISSLISGDNITLMLSLNMSQFSQASPSLNIFVKFNVYSSTTAYSFSLDPPGSTSETTSAP